ncbi:hypothetical protein [Halomarina oriensis]|uniref:MarR family transcriptional regulator n=1 Tax=Halomarina oriensis TaxID=671145 RepID=A0A6B0GJR2_9EURY|nr:hypothetical protein [Halomarina oriensis]MWG34840.1 hypothetical protein [Halomarina oriensis]
MSNDALTIPADLTSCSPKAKLIYSALAMNGPLTRQQLGETLRLDPDYFDHAFNQLREADVVWSRPTSTGETLYSLR